MAEQQNEPTVAPEGEKADPLVKFCPNCNRKLLTQSSALCNWCGAKIDDPEYQERAAQSRHSLDEAERTAIEELAQEESRFGVLGRLKRRAKLMPDGSSKIGNDLSP